MPQLATLSGLRAYTTDLEQQVSSHSFQLPITPRPQKSARHHSPPSSSGHAATTRSGKQRHHEREGWASTAIERREMRANANLHILMRVHASVPQHAAHLGQKHAHLVAAPVQAPSQQEHGPALDALVPVQPVGRGRSASAPKMLDKVRRLCLGQARREGMKKERREGEGGN